MARASQRERRRGRTAQRRGRSSRQIMTACRRDAHPASRGRRASIRSSLYQHFGIVRAPHRRNSRPGAGPPWPATSRSVLPGELQKLGSIVRRSPARLAPGWGPRARRIAVPRPPPRVACHTLSTRKGCDRVCSGCRAGGRPTARSTDGVAGWSTPPTGSHVGLAESRADDNCLTDPSGKLNVCPSTPPPRSPLPARSPA